MIFVMGGGGLTFLIFTELIKGMDIKIKIKISVFSSFTIFRFNLQRCYFLHLPPYLSIPLLSILTDMMLYTACRSTLHQGLASPSSVFVQLLTTKFVPLLPSTAYAALQSSFVVDCSAGLPNAMFGRTVHDITKNKDFCNNDKKILFSTAILWAKYALIAIVVIKYVLFKQLAYTLNDIYPKLLSNQMFFSQCFI